MSTLKRLLKHPHAAVFDKSPDAALAFTLRRSGGLAWLIADGTMTLTTPSRVYTYDLAAYTVGSLMSRLKLDGFEAKDPAFFAFGRSAMILVEGQGDTSLSNGDQIMAFKSQLWALYSAYAVELRLAKAQITEALKQMVIWKSEGEWTDVWGDLFGISREDEETDPHYAARIPKEAFRLRVNKYAIEMAIRELTGRRVFIRETWPDMFRLDESRLSGTSRLTSGEMWRYGYIQPVATSLFDWTGVLEVIERNKAAGVIVLPPRVEVSDLVIGHLDGRIAFAILAAYGALVTGNDDVRLDWMELGNARHNRNWRLRIGSESVHQVEGHLNGWIAFGIGEERPPAVLLYGVPSFAPKTTIRTDERAPFSVNFNKWSAGRYWSAGDTWVSRGASVPRRVFIKIEHIIEEIPIVIAADQLHQFVHTTLPRNLSE